LSKGRRGFDKLNHRCRYSAGDTAAAATTNAAVMAVTALVLGAVTAITAAFVVAAAAVSPAE